MNFMTGLYVKMLNKFETMKNDEKGSQTLEWLGIAAVIIIVVGLISQSFEGDTAFGDKVKTAFSRWIDKIAGP